MDGVTIVDSTAWSNVLAIIWQGLRFLDSIVLFDVRDVHLTFLGFDIAVMAFGIVWNTCGLWSYDFDSAWSDGSSDFDDGDGEDASSSFTGFRHFNEDGDDYSELDIIPDDDDDDAL